MVERIRLAIANDQCDQWKKRSDYWGGGTSVAEGIAWGACYDAWIFWFKVWCEIDLRVHSNR